jgi:cobalt-zinc-cadmium efflux system outer membrane protein
MARISKRPVRFRTGPMLMGLLAATICSGSHAEILEPISESTVVRAALQLSAARELRAAALDAASGERDRAGRWSNPEIGWNQEKLDGPVDATETVYGLTQTIPLGGKLSLERDAAARRYDAAEQAARGGDVERAAAARRAFTEALHRDGAAAVHRRWADELGRAALAVDALAKAGDASRYDAQRVARAAANARALAAAADAERLHARERLVGLTGDSSLRSAPLAGDPPAPLRPLEAYLDEVAADPRLREFASRAEAAEFESQRAGRRWVPDLDVTVGQKTVEVAGASESGLVLGFSVPLPLFDTGSAEKRQLAGEARILRSHYALQMAGREADVRGTWELARSLERTASDLAPSTSLGQVASAAYQGGEGSLLELIDAYDAERETALVSLELSQRARMARIELDALVGVIP